MNIVALVNGRARKKGRVLSDLKRIHDHKVHIWVTKQASDTQKFAKEAVESNTDLLIICGGDGTANKVVNELMNFEPSKRPTIAIFPCGSANDFSKSLTYNNIQATISRFAKGEIFPVDLCQLSTLKQSVYALNMATCGIGANVVQSVNLGKYWIPPSIRFFLATVSWIIRYKPSKLRIRVGDMMTDNQLFLAAFGNGKYVGSGLGLCPQAELNNGKFAVTLIGKIGLFDFLRHLNEIKKAKFVKNDPRILYHSSHFAEIKVMDGKLSIETDGEFFQTLRKGDSVRFGCAASAIKFVSGA